MAVLNELRMRPPVAQPWGWDASVRARLVLSIAAISALLIGANLATPLYPLLQARLGLGPFAVTIAFTSYVLTLMTGLVLVGHWSDYMGRRAALVIAVLVGLAGVLVFAAAQSLTMLVAGRVLQGAAVALATGASSAALRDLLPSRPEWASRFTLLASAGGVAAGPVIGGALSLLPNPTTTPFVINAVMLLAVLSALVVLKARPAVRPVLGRAAATLRPKRPALARAARGHFWLASGVGFISFAVFGFCLSLAPTYFAPIAGTESRLAIGVLAALALAASAVCQLVSLRGRYLVPVSLLGLGVSVALIPVSGATGSLMLLTLATVAAGAFQGAAFRVAFNDVAVRVEPARHAQVVSSLYVMTYLGSALPVLGLGAATGAWGLDPSVAAYGVGIAVGCLALAFWSLVLTRRARRF